MTPSENDARPMDDDDRARYSRLILFTAVLLGLVLLVLWFSSFVLIQEVAPVLPSPVAPPP